MLVPLLRDPVAVARILAARLLADSPDQDRPASAERSPEAHLEASFRTGLALLHPRFATALLDLAYLYRGLHRAAEGLYVWGILQKRIADAVEPLR